MVGQIFSQRSPSYFGFPIAPHDVRDAAVTTWAIAAPDRIGVDRDLLTHHDPQTGIRYYNRARGIEASRVHAQVMPPCAGKISVAPADYQ
jgi:integrase